MSSRMSDFVEPNTPRTYECHMKKGRCVDMVCKHVSYFPVLQGAETLRLFCEASRVDIYIPFSSHLDPGHPFSSSESRN